MTAVGRQGCKKDAAVHIPVCIQDKIDAISQQPKFNPPATVYRYVYRDNYVYLFTADCCDQYDYVYDRECQVICAPSGGIAGHGDGRCPNFEQVATEKTVIWHDAR